MPTTIQVKQATLEKLKAIKQDKGIPTYDALLEYFIKKEQDVPDDLFGYVKGKMTPFSQDEEDQDHEL
ncbi:MAG TPA: hypothetical protein VKM55_02920 [Candidatus Lokiarchaeia archaeon]|nr:hypothetical protein [Candidatus Lokiarchaeia archaeon]